MPEVGDRTPGLQPGTPTGEGGRAPARIGVDIGGTFTDVVYSTGEGEGPVFVKTPTTPRDITTGILTALEEAGVDPARLEFFLHGTTVALNAFLEGKTPPVGLITTQGFADVLEIMRTNRPDMYNLQQAKPPPLVKRRHRREISARMTSPGAELVPLDEREVAEIGDDFAAAGIEAVAVCLLHSYANPEHERRVRDLLVEAHPEFSVSISSDLTREWREFERTSTTVINAATGPIMDRYLRRLAALLAERGFRSNLLIMQSSSGVMTAGDAARRPVATLMSGPVGGVAGAESIAKELGRDVNLLTLDIGGTSADAAIVDAGHAVHTPQAELGRWPVLMPMVDIQSIGAGGGSLASVDEHGGLSVGPASAGADPGPACYARGGVRASVTDANLVLGRIDGGRFLGGDLPLDVEAARAAVERDVAAPYRMPVEEAAEGIIRVVNSNMSRLLRDVLIQRGYDPRTFTLIAFGGGGPLHACAVADEAGIPHVLIPPHPGTLSAYGIFCADVRQDKTAMFLRPAADVASTELESAFAELEREARSAVPGDLGFGTAVLRNAELRYNGQEYALPVEGAPGLDAAGYADRFAAEHRRLYGFVRDGVPVEFVKLGVSYVVRTGDADQEAAPSRGAGGSLPASRTVWDQRAPHEAAVYERVDLGLGATADGPAIIEEPGATTYVPPGWAARVDDRLNIALGRREAHR